MEQAIKKVRSVGYIPFWEQHGQVDHYGDQLMAEDFMNPLFWQCLGKAMGWEQGEFEVCFGCGIRITKKTPRQHDGKHYACKADIMWYPSEWRFQAELFFNRTMEGKDAESFFNELLNHNGK